MRVLVVYTMCQPGLYQERQRLGGCTQVCSTPLLGVNSSHTTLYQFECCWLQLKENLTKQKGNILFHTTRSPMVREAQASPSGLWLHQSVLIISALPFCAGFVLRRVEDGQAVLCIPPNTVTAGGRRGNHHACLVLLRKRLEDFLMFHWPAFGHMQITKPQCRESCD